MEVKPSPGGYAVDAFGRRYDQVDPRVKIDIVEDILNLCRAASIWPLLFGIACCAMEFIGASMSRFDTDRFGIIPRGTPRQSDVLVVPGTISKKFVDPMIRLYEQMPAPKWVIAMGNCAISGGPFAYEGQYAIVEGTDKFLPVDVYIPGCPPRPEALLRGYMELQKKITESGKIRYFEKKYPKIDARATEVQPFA